MADKALQKLSRKELLEIMISQGEEIQRLREQLRIAEQKQSDRELCIKESGTMAEAALKLNNVFRDADAAARQYLSGIQLLLRQQQETLLRVQEKEQELRAELSRIKAKGGSPNE